MKHVGRVLLQVLRVVGSSIWAFVLWTFWLVLVLVAGLQIYVASTNEVAVPGFVLDRLQGRLNESGIRVTFDRASFDPTGRILIHSPQVFLAGIGDPIVTAKAAYVGLDPWLLAIGHIDAREVRLLGATVSVPAMFSDSGRPQPVISDLDAFLVPASRQLLVRHVTGRVGRLALSVHGAITLGGAREEGAPDVAASLRAHFREFCRIATEVVRRLDAFEEPALDIALEPASTRGTILNATISARSVKLTAPMAVEGAAMRLRLRVPLLGDAPALSRGDLFLHEAKLAEGIELRDLNASAEMPFQLSKPALGALDFYATAGAVKKDDVWARDIAAWGRSNAAQHWQATVEARVLGAPLSVSGEADLAAKSAELHLVGSVAPGVVDIISGRTGVDVRRFFAFSALDCLRSTAWFGPGWKFERARATVTLRTIQAHGVTIDDGAAEIEIDPKRLYAPDAYARIGSNFARGSYEHEFATHQFRFLLDGQLRPLDISEWFRGWWPNFFSRLDFPQAPPAASVDVNGIWREGRRTVVFVFADANQPVILGQPFQRVRTRLFIRPGFYDGLELFATDPHGNARGVFAFTSDMDTAKWRTFDIDANSTVAFALGRQIAEALKSSVLTPFDVEQPPAVRVKGHFDGPAVETERHRQLEVEAHTSGGFRFYQFPLQDVSFIARLHDDEITVDQIEGHFAGGKVQGHAKVWGEAADRRLGFDAAVTDASLGQAVAGVQNFTADRKGQPHPPPGKFVQEKANVRVDIAASAEGVVGNAFSYHGNGNASLRGAEIGAVPLFGPLSELLKFTALRFTTAQANFKINGSKLEFPTVALRGANSAIDAHGQYALDRRELDFRAKVFPFEESGSVIKSVVGAVLTPISNVLEVKLTGSLEKPDWAFVIGPTNFFRSLAPSTPETPPPEPEAPAPPAGKTPP